MCLDRLGGGHSHESRLTVTPALMNQVSPPSPHMSLMTLMSQHVSCVT